VINVSFVAAAYSPGIANNPGKVKVSITVK